MEWLSQNWFWVVVFVAFFAVHLFGHGGHGGGHGGCGGGPGRQRPPDKSDTEENQAEPPPGHQH